jgi:hypothetical protein
MNWRATLDTLDTLALNETPIRATKNFRRVIKDEHAKVRDYWCASRPSLEYELGLKLSCPEHGNGKIEQELAKKIPCSRAIGGSARIRMTSTLMSSELECAHVLANFLACDVAMMGESNFDNCGVLQ